MIQSELILFWDETPAKACESTLLELSAREIQALMQRFGVCSESCPEGLETIDLLLALQTDASTALPPPQFVPVSGNCVH